MSRETKTGDLTVTSYAILGQLALRPWSAYELTKQLRRNVRFFWPRAESRIYDEAKRLVFFGLASAERSQIGRRPRTTYSITPLGRRRLRRWLGQEPAPGFALEYEAILRVFLSNFAEPDDLIRALEQVRDDTADLAAMATEIGYEYVEGRAPFQELVANRALIHDGLSHFALALNAWARRALDEVESWDELAPESRADRATARIRETLRELESVPVSSRSSR